jgi:S1-C subfamily serine protease
MIVHVGNIKKEKFKETVVRKSNKLRILFVFLLIFLPLIVYFPFHWKWFSSGPVVRQNVLEAVANVRTAEGTGTAFLVGNKRLLTAGHVVQNLNIGDKVDLVFEKANPKITTQASVIWKSNRDLNDPANYQYDAAVLELTRPSDIPSDFSRLSIGSSANTTIGEHIIVIGFPSGLFSRTEGVISNDRINNLELFQFDAGSWPGNSGGPLVKKEGNDVIGINVAGFQGPFQGINMACKIDIVVGEIKKAGIDINL